MERGGTQAPEHPKLVDRTRLRTDVRAHPAHCQHSHAGRCDGGHPPVECGGDGVFQIGGIDDAARQAMGIERKRKRQAHQPAAKDNDISLFHAALLMRFAMNCELEHFPVRWDHLTADRKSTRLNSSNSWASLMQSFA